MGCGTAAVPTADVTVGTAYVEVRYSKTCEAAWAARATACATLGGGARARTTPGARSWARGSEARPEEFVKPGE
ncbi:DUF2690 domain-containing protein [Streptomyces sp. OE57]|uniref:DUF2690 domain-containing protein n=1 Tax=Streptomyces lacaronensis TaxID=3379885 RepID=UPI0039B75645